jgi:hypothetical protein
MMIQSHRALISPRPAEMAEEAARALDRQRPEDLPRRTLFDDRAAIHHHDPVAIEAFFGRQMLHAAVQFNRPALAALPLDRDGRLLRADLRSPET